MLNSKEIRKVVREGIRNDSKGIYTKACVAKQVLLFDPEYGIYGDYMDFATFNTALQAMANACKISFLEACRIVKIVRNIAIDVENWKFNMPSTKEVIKALE